MTRHAPVALSAAAVYLLVLASTDPADIAAALVIGGLVAFAARGQPRVGRTAAGPVWSRVAHFPAWAAVVARDVASGVLAMSRATLRRSDPPRAGIVAVPIGERSPAGVAGSAIAATLSPGDVLVDVDWERGVMLVHLLDASDPDAARAAYLQRYERYQRRVLP